MRTDLRPLAALALLLPLLASAAPARAADPVARCQRATTKALSSCLAQVAKGEAGCFRKDGAACPSGERKREKALAKVEKTLLRGCADAAAVGAAGYAPLEPGELVARFQAACAREVEDLAARLFGGPDAPTLGGASDADAKCLHGAAKLSATLLGKALKAVGKCAGRSCDAADLDHVDAKLARLEEKTATKIGKKCDDLVSLVGMDAEALVSETRGRATTAASAPCDPLDEGHCLFPLTNDYFTVGDETSPTGHRLHFSTHAMPRSFDGTPIDPTKWNVVDGWSVGPVLALFDPALDLTQSGVTPITDLASSLDPDAPLLLLDAETGEPQPVWAERDATADDVSEQAVLVRVGTNLPNGRRFIVAFRDLRDAAGDPLPAGAAFAAYRDRIATAELPREARRAHMEALFDTLEGFGLSRSELDLAWDFTTQSVESTSEALLHMRDDAFDNVLGTSAPAFTVDNVVEPLDADTFRRIDGTFQVPLYLTDGGIPGSELRLGADGLPENQGDFFTASFRCVIPYAATTAGAAPAVPARAALYGHGLLGDAGETGASHVRALASEHNFVICGTDWTGFADEDESTVFDVLADFSNFPHFIERQHQGVLNFLVLARMLQHPDGFASDPAFQVGGESVIDPSDVFYDGNSQGGILGGVLAAFAQDIERFVLGVPGINYSTLLTRSADFEPFDILLRATYPDALDRAALLAVAQILWDRTDPSGHVRHTTSDTYPNTPPKKLLYHVAFGDRQVAPVTAEIAARSNGARIHTPVLVPGKIVPEVDPYFGIPPIPSYPFDGSAIVVWDSGNPAPPTGNVPPPEIGPLDPEWADLSPCAQNWDSDPHECPRRQPEARLQKSEFLRSDGAVVDVCGGMACLAPTF